MILNSCIAFGFLVGMRVSTQFFASLSTLATTQASRPCKSQKDRALAVHPSCPLDPENLFVVSRMPPLPSVSAIARASLFHRKRPTPCHIITNTRFCNTPSTSRAQLAPMPVSIRRDEEIPYNHPSRPNVLQHPRTCCNIRLSSTTHLEYPLQRNSQVFNSYIDLGFLASILTSTQIFASTSTLATTQAKPPCKSQQNRSLPVHPSYPPDPRNLFVLFVSFVVSHKPHPPPHTSPLYQAKRVKFSREIFAKLAKFTTNTARGLHESVVSGHPIARKILTCVHNANPIPCQSNHLHHHPPPNSFQKNSDTSQNPVHSHSHS